MKEVVILVPETAIPGAIVDPKYMFTAVNEFYKSAGHSPFFNIRLAGLKKKVNLDHGSLTIHPDVLIHDIKKADLILIPALSGNMQEAIHKNKTYIPWLVQQYQSGAEIASLCVGSFLLAATGLLNNKSCSTHWLFAADFRNLFPEVNLTHDKIITEQNGLYSSGGATSYWNLLLYLVEKHTSREMSIMASKFFLLEMGRNSQSPFVMFQGQKNHEDDQIVKAQEYIEQYYHQKITVEDLASRFDIGRRTFERRFKKATNNTVVEYTQRVKIEAAKKLLETTRMTISEVMHNTGYADTKAFREVFKKITGLSPTDYKAKYN